MIMTLLDFRILVRKFLPFATIVSLAIFVIVIVIVFINVVVVVNVVIVYLNVVKGHIISSCDQ